MTKHEVVAGGNAGAVVTTTAPAPVGIVATMAAAYGMATGKFEQALRATVVPKDATPEQFAVFLLVAKKYGLNPLVKEIYAFPARSGGIQPIVSIDGWMRIINDHPAMDGLDFEDHLNPETGELEAITAILYRRDRTHPVRVREYMKECRRNTDTWKQWPARMLRHKAAIQAARYAFGFSGIVDPDEGERIRLATIAPEESTEQAEQRSGVAKLRKKLAASTVAEAAPAPVASETEVVGAAEAPVVQPAPTESFTLDGGNGSDGEIPGSSMTAEERARFEAQR